MKIQNRARESENEAKRAAAAERWATMRAAAEEVRRRRDEEADAMKMTAGGKMAELEGRVASFRNRQKVILVFHSTATTVFVFEGTSLTIGVDLQRRRETTPLTCLS